MKCFLVPVIHKNVTKWSLLKLLLNNYLLAGTITMAWKKKMFNYVIYRIPGTPQDKIFHKIS